MTTSPAQFHDYGDVERAEMLSFVPRAASVVLDVGCGTGGFGAALGARELYGIEPFPEAARRALDRPEFTTVWCGTFPDDLPQEAPAFDCIVFNDVLEHMVDPWHALDAARGLLSDDGCIVASIPNVRYWPVLKSLLVYRDWRYEDYGVLDRTHLRWFTEKSMRRLFEESGLLVDSVTPINVARSSRWHRLARIPRLGELVGDLAVMQFVVTARPPR